MAFLQARSQGGARGAKEPPPPHGPKESKMVHNFGHVLLVTILNGIQLDHNIYKCITLNHIFQLNIPGEYSPNMW